ncbi:putative RNA-directed DNA polymerase from transposon BS [Trichonephila clavipes]|nr:putative RNA-directed DNA polymerase from transposon BS [Trichonephila clavipes]
MSALESLHFLTERRHPTVIEILILLRKLERKGFDIIFSWVPGRVGILSNEQADTAARSMSDHMQWPVCYQDLKTSTQNYIHRVWQETWDQQILNKLHNIHPSPSHWATLPMRRHDVRLTRLRIGHTRFTHRHLLLAWPKLALAPLKLTIIINNHQRERLGVVKFSESELRLLGKGWNDGCDLVLALKKEEMGLALFWVPSLSVVGHACKVMQLIRLMMCEWMNKQ